MGLRIPFGFVASQLGMLMVDCQRLDIRNMRIVALLRCIHPKRHLSYSWILACLVDG